VPKDFLTTNEKVSFYDGILGENVFAYGIAQYYCEMSNLFDDAQHFKEKFESAINKCMQGVVRKRVMKERKWVF